MCSGVVVWRRAVRVWSVVKSRGAKAERGEGARCLGRPRAHRGLSPVCRPCRPCRQLVDLVDHCRPVVDRELSMCCQLLVDHCRRCRLKIDRYHVCTLSIVVDIVDLSTCRLVDLSTCVDLYVRRGWLDAHLHVLYLSLFLRTTFAMVL